MGQDGLDGHQISFLLGDLQSDLIGARQSEECPAELTLELRVGQVLVHQLDQDGDAPGLCESTAILLAPVSEISQGHGIVQQDHLICREVLEVQRDEVHDLLLAHLPAEIVVAEGENSDESHDLRLDHAIEWVGFQEQLDEPYLWVGLLDDILAALVVAAIAGEDEFSDGSQGSPENTIVLGR